MNPAMKNRFPPSWQHRSLGWLAVRAVACLTVWINLFLPHARAAGPAGSIQFPAWTFDRGNGMTIYNPDIYADYRDKFPELVVSHGGQLPWAIEFDIDFPVDTTYTLHVHYGSPGKRPLEVWLDDTRIGACCGRITGNAAPYPDRHPPHERPRYDDGTHGLEWEEAIKLPAAKGKHTLKFTCKGPPPNLNALKLDSPVAFPKEWKLGTRKPNLERMQANCRRIFLPPGSVNIAALQLAIEDMTREFGPRYPSGEPYLKRLAELEKMQAAAASGTTNEQQTVEAELQALQRDAMLAHPALKFDRLLFLKQKHVAPSVYTEHVVRSPGGGNLCVLSPVSPDGTVTELVPELAGGRFGRFDLSCDATRIVFCYAKEGGRNRIYEVEIDPNTGRRVPGKRPRQLTFSTDREAETMRLYAGSFCGVGYDDVDPCYLPNGGIMFASTRSHRAVLCRGMTATTLHVMDGDGKNIRCISGGQVNELAPSVLDDGRVAYPRWEYVDKGFANAVSVWAVRPDGSGSDHVYKNTVVRPCALIDIRSIPRSRRLVTVGAGHHLGLAGPLIMVDNRRNRRNAKGMINLTPEISYPGMYPMRGKNGAGRFRQPYPFSEKFFLVAHNAPAAGFSLHAFDAWGNRAQLYGDPDISCFQPVPLRPRTKPTEIPAVARHAAEEEAGTATLFVRDVYQGLTGIERGRVKYVRVMEAQILPWEQAFGAESGPGMQMSAVSYAADPAIKMMYGVAKVHEDGSAFFTAPADKNIFFQALDENYMELQRMRTFINLVPGEKRSCIGCHELRSKVPNLTTVMPRAMERGVQTLSPQPGDTGPRAIHYARDVQPIFDRYCLSCHSGPKPEGELNLAGEPTSLFSISYENLMKKYLVSFLEGGYGSANLPAEPPMTFGSHQSKLVERMRRPPCKADLSREEFIRLVTWIDANAPFYGTHEGKKNMQWKDKPNFRPFPLAYKD